VSRLKFAAGALVVALSATSHGLAQKPTAPATPPTTAGALKPADLDRLLGPVALYPDALLGQILLCAGNPGRVATLDEWLRSHPDLKGTALQDAAKAAGFTESFVAIVLFPDVVSTMAQQIDWTSGVGAAFTADRSAVFTSIQRLRQQAQAAGKLKTTAQQEVDTRTTATGQEVIVIEPANPQIVYVPQYNPQTVYTTSTVVVQETDDSDAAVAAGLIGFTAGIALGAAIDNDYYYGPYGWRGGVYMYDDAWDDWADHREDTREDWMDHREDLAEDRGDRARTSQEQRTERTQSRQENRPETQAQREQRRTDAKAAAPSATGASAEARSANRDSARATTERSGTRSDAFSGYSSGKSERAASSRGNSSRSSSRGGGGRRR